MLKVVLITAASMGTACGPPRRTRRHWEAVTRGRDMTKEGNETEKEGDPERKGDVREEKQREDKEGK